MKDPFWKPKEGDKIAIIDDRLSVGFSYYQDEHGNLEMRELSLIDDGFVRGRSCCEVLRKAVDKIHLNTVFPLHVPDRNGAMVYDAKLATSITSLSKEISAKFYEDLMEAMRIIERIESQKKTVKRFKSSMMFVRGGRKQTRFWWF